MDHYKFDYMLEHPNKLNYRNGENVKVGIISRKDLQRETDRAYLAGILDGEGYIGMHIRRYYQNHPNLNARGRGFMDIAVQIGNTDIRMIAKISQILYREKIKFYFRIMKSVKETQRNVISIYCYGQKNIYKLLLMVYPYLANKKEVAEKMMEMLQYSKTRFIYGNRPKIDTIEDLKLAEYEKEIKRINRYRPDILKESRKANLPIILQKSSETIRQTAKADDIVRSA